MSKKAAVGNSKTRATRKKNIDDDSLITKPAESNIKIEATLDEENDTEITKDAAKRSKKKEKANTNSDVEVPRALRSRKKGKSGDENGNANHDDETDASSNKKVKSDDVEEVTKPVLPKSKKKGKSNIENGITSVKSNDDAEITKPTSKSRRKVKSDNEISATTNKAITSKSKKKRRSDDESDSEATKPKSKKKEESGDAAVEKSKSRKGKKKAAEEEKVEEIKEEVVNMKTVIIKGKAPVDPECITKVGVSHVYTEDDDVYDAMLNQTNLQNNNNKYYIIQLLEDDSQKSYDVWMRWGRVGKKGQTSLVPCGSNLEKALKTFKQKFFDKTKNQWDERFMFEKVSGKYDLLKMDYNIENEKKNLKKPVKSEVKQVESKIHERIKNLIELICDVKKMEEEIMEMKYDAKKAPLGKLTTEQIKSGYAALKKIEKCITENKTTGSELLNACNEFYTRIPHDFGMKRPPLITSQDDLRSKILLLETLGDIQIALKMIKEEVDNNEHPADRHYQSLCCQLQPLDQSDETYKILEQYLDNTHGKTHNQYKLKIVDIFECNKDGEKEKFKDLGNRTLLWHGSRLTNWAGILKQGLRIAPPEAPVTGYMFGKGVYFADMCSKSANYCFANRNKNEGLLVLCEVSLGNSRELLDSDYNGDKLPKGKHSVKGLGSMIPDPKSDIVLPDGVRVPLGKGIDSGVKNPNSYTLNYNEYIVYDTSQIRMRYLMRVKFCF